MKEKTLRKMTMEKIVVRILEAFVMIFELKPEVKIGLHIILLQCNLLN